MKFDFTFFAILRLILAAVFISGAQLYLSAPAAAQDAPAAPTAPPTVIKTIQVQGNQRIEANTVASYLLFAPGDPYSETRLDTSIKTLYATGLFADVSIDPRDGNVLVSVIENPIINRVILEGNKSLKSDKITDEISAEPRAIFTRSNIQEDVTRIIELYRQSGRFAATVEPKVVQQPQNRVDLIFVITEGPVTGVKRINIIGNAEFPDRRLRKEMATTESSWYKFFSSNDNYDPGRLQFDQEQLRTFYTNRGFADFRVVSAVAELTPDQEDFYITFTVDEGDEYRWGDISVETELDSLSKDFLQNLVPFRKGEIYNASRVEDAIDSLNFAAGIGGFAFVDIQPQIQRNRDTQTVDMVFNVIEGQRTYIERIDIVGNTTTLDSVIRRQLELVEGDAFNRILLERSRSRVRSLRFFENVEITEVQGSSPDRAIVEVAVTEQPTGELSFSAGFSSADAFLVDLSITQRNLRGRGQTLSFVIQASSNRRSVDLRFTEPRFLGRNLAASFNVFDVVIDLVDEAQFRQRRTGGQVTFAFPLTENTRFSGRYTLRQEDIEFPDDDECPALLAGLAPTTNALSSLNTLALCEQLGGRLSSILGYSFTWDRRNDPITPTGGFDVQLSQDLAGLGGDVRFLRTDVSANYYKGLFKDVIASASLKGGFIRGWGDDTVAINDRFFKGNFDFRGFDNAGVGPRVLQFETQNAGDPVTEFRLDRLGGNAFGLAIGEVSFPLAIDSLMGSLFIEAGTVGLLDEQDQFNEIIGFSDTALGNFFDVGDSCEGIEIAGVICQRTEDGLLPRVTAGISVFWESPFGPIRFDFTEPLVQQPFDDRKSFQFTTRTRF